DTLHIISHGSPGCLYLGNSQLSLDTLKQYAPEVQQWDIDNLVLYGCYVAAGDAGEEFVGKLSGLMGANIAASKTLTGSVAKGGNWELELNTGQQRPTSALQTEVVEAYSGVLAPNGLKGDYFSDAGLANLAFTRTDSKINFNWSLGSPNTNKVGNDHFSIRWTGYIVPKHSEEYTFTTVSDDGVRLWVNNQNLIDEWRQYPATPHHGKITLEAEKAYPITLEYFEWGGYSSARLEWESNSQTREIIPESQFFINDVNEAPTDLDLDNKTIDENVAPNSVVGTFSTTDPDSGDSFTYTLVTGDGDTDNSAFTINGDQLQINDSPDYETKSSYSIRVQTTDGEGASYTEQLTINVNDVNEDVIEGTPGKDIFRGSDSAENYSALAGNDRVYGNGGDDTIDGGEGNDIIYGGNDDDLLNGGLGHDRLYGDNGNDQLLGQDGNDILYGGAGDDILNGGPGNDRYNGGAGTDTLIIAPGMGLDMIQGFEDGTDTIKLEAGIGFADLDIVSSGSSTLIKLTATQETLARISGIDVSLVGEADFTV
ncbi:MAG: DUF4347 domain-containing protein, partial [Trichodesmium sp. St18_bin1]|nr:DUF4347 domain-containing protein [Trichodesmium sp. St18_bin1]